MPNDLQLSDQDEVLLESLVLAASDNVTRAPGSDRSQFAPTRRRVFVETDGNENVYLGTGNAWVDVSENTGLLSSLFGGGDGNFDSVDTGSATVTNQVDAGSVNTDDATVEQSLSRHIDGSEDSIEPFFNLVASNAGDSVDRSQITTNVSTSETNIAEVTEEDQIIALIMVSGLGPSSYRFFDLIWHSPSVGQKVVTSLEAGSPAGRTYSRTDGNNDLGLTMASDTYNVRVRVIELGSL